MLQLPLESKLVDIAFSYSGTRIAVLSDTSVSVYALDLKKRPITKPSLIYQYNIEDFRPGHSPRQVTFAKDEKLYILTDLWDEEESFIWIASENDNGAGGSITEVIPILHTEKVSSIASDVGGEHTFVHFQDGSVEILSERPEVDMSLDYTSIAKLPTFAPEVKVATLDGQVGVQPRFKMTANETQRVAFGLTKSGVLYANELMLVRNCTSFVVTSAHLIFTTTQHLLKFVHLTRLNGELQCTSFIDFI